jgi:hypothetical protein
MTLNNWLSSRVLIDGHRDAGISISLLGGTADFSRATLEPTSGSGAANRVPLKIQLDRLKVTSGITLTQFQGELITGSVTEGTFTALVNGGAPISGRLGPGEHGTAVRVVSDRAGEVFRSAGVFENAREGSFDMVLVPNGGEGSYDGILAVENTRVINVPALAELLSAISVVGLLEKLGGEGIVFSNVDAKFRIDPDVITLLEGSAIGFSLGLTMEGIYELAKSAMNMRGVITPIYAVNGIFEQSKLFAGLFGSKKGEGVFGFNYEMGGNVGDPKVSVNPLSILTPGLFREIFRAPLPKPSQ